MHASELERELVAAIQRCHTIERGLQGERREPRLTARVVKALQQALDILGSAQEQLVESQGQIVRMESFLGQQAAKYHDLVTDMPVPFLLTQLDTLITEANDAASRLLNVDPRAVRGRPLSLFICENRAELLSDCSRAQATCPVRLTVRLRPRERAPLTVIARVVRRADILCWTLEPLLDVP